MASKGKAPGGPVYSITHTADGTEGPRVAVSRDGKELVVVSSGQTEPVARSTAPLVTVVAETPALSYLPDGADVTIVSLELRDHEIAEVLTWGSRGPDCLIINGQDWGFEEGTDLLVPLNMSEHPEGAEAYAVSEYGGGSGFFADGSFDLRRLGTLYQEWDFDSGVSYYFREKDESEALAEFISFSLFTGTWRVVCPQLDQMSDEALASIRPSDRPFDAYSIFANDTQWIYVPEGGFVRTLSMRTTPVDLEEGLALWTPVALEVANEEGVRRLEVAGSERRTREKTEARDPAPADAASFIVALLDDEGWARMPNVETAWIALYDAASKRSAVVSRVLLTPASGITVPGVSMDASAEPQGLVHAFGQPFYFATRPGELRVLGRGGEEIGFHSGVERNLGAFSDAACAQRLEGVFKEYCDRMSGMPYPLDE